VLVHSEMWETCDPNSMAVTDPSSVQMREGGLIEEDLEVNLYLIRLNSTLKEEIYTHLPETNTPFLQFCTSSSICCLREEVTKGWAEKTVEVKDGAGD
jgi:hypothetical protein